MAYQQDFDTTAVVGHVADIVHAFKEGVSYLKRIQGRRRTRPVPPGCVVDIKSMQDLEFSLTRGQDVVRSHYERDYRRLGQPYATGDHEAAVQLKTVLSELQKVVVVNLRNAYQHDQHVDFLVLQDLSDDSQDRAIMSLIQLHQRVLMSGDMDNIVSGDPYTGNKRSQSRSRGPPRVAPEPTIQVPPNRRPQGQDHHDQEDLHSFRHTNAPLTPDLSPLQEHVTLFSPSSSQHSSLRRPKPPMLPIDDRQPTVPTLPTPPADKVLGAPPGPPPTAPLPPAPIDVTRQKRREELAGLRNEAERRARQYRNEDDSARPFADRSFGESRRISPGSRQKPSTAPAQYEFQEPHPGTPVDPCHVDEPRHLYGSPGLRIAAPSGDASFMPLSGASPQQAYKPYDQHHLSPHRLASSPSEADHLESHGPGSTSLARPERLSTVSTATYSSHASGASGLSGVSRATTSSSNSSFDIPPVPNTAAMSFAARSKSAARVPEPIYESYNHSESIDTIRPRTAESRRPSGPQLQLQSQSPTQTQPRYTLTPSSSHTHPPMPPVPAETPRTIDTRRASAFSHHSTSSAGSAQPSPTPIRIIPPTITDASNSKLYLPSEANKFGGLCKAAWRAQIGDFKKAYQAQQRPGGMASNRLVDFMKCKTCEFSGKVALNERGKKGPDRKVITAKDSGVAYRWDFLFKSHCALKGGSSADAEFGCMFCCAEGKGTLVFKGMVAFVSHLAEHRPGAVGTGCEVPDATVCDRMEAVVGRTLMLDERSEIALPAVDGPLSPPLSSGMSIGGSRH